MVTLEALLQQNNAATEDRRGSEAAAGAKGALGLTYVTATAGRLWSSALRMDSQKVESAAERTVRCVLWPLAMLWLGWQAGWVGLSWVDLGGSAGHIPPEGGERSSVYR